LPFCREKIYEETLWRGPEARLYGDEMLVFFPREGGEAGALQCKNNRKYIID